MDRKAAEEAVERQRRTVLAASQEVSGLDKLQEKQWEEYRHLYAKDSERQISEYLTMQVNRQKETF